MHLNLYLCRLKKHSFMNISYNWLKKYIDFDLTPDEVAAALTSTGLETFCQDCVDFVRRMLRLPTGVLAVPTFFALGTPGAAQGGTIPRAASHAATNTFDRTVRRSKHWHRLTAPEIE